MRIPFLSKLIQSRDTPKNSIFGNTYTFFFGSTSSGKTVNERTALQTTAVYACVRVLAEAIASLPLHTYRYQDNGKEKARLISERPGKMDVKHEKYGSARRDIKLKV